LAQKQQNKVADTVASGSCETGLENKNPSSTEVLEKLDTAISERKPVPIMCGVNETEMAVAGKTVGEVRKAVAGMLNVAADAQCYLKGVAVSDDHLLDATTEQVEFLKPAGTKGA